MILLAVEMGAGWQVAVIAIGTIQTVALAYIGAKFSATQRNGGVRVKPTELPPTYTERQRMETADDETKPATLEVVTAEFPVVDPTTKNPGA